MRMGEGTAEKLNSGEEKERKTFICHMDIWWLFRHEVVELVPEMAHFGENVNSDLRIYLQVNF